MKTIVRKYEELNLRLSTFEEKINMVLLAVTK